MFVVCCSYPFSEDVKDAMVYGDSRCVLVFMGCFCLLPTGYEGEKDHHSYEWSGIVEKLKFVWDSNPWPLQYQLVQCCGNWANKPSCSWSFCCIFCNKPVSDELKYQFNLMNHRLENGDVNNLSRTEHYLNFDFLGFLFLVVAEVAFNLASFFHIFF